MDLLRVMARKRLCSAAKLFVLKSRQPSVGCLDSRPSEAPGRINIHAAIVNENDFIVADDRGRTVEEFDRELCQSNIR